jgi:hypothetical protein
MEQNIPPLIGNIKNLEYAKDAAKAAANGHCSSPAASAEMIVEQGLFSK